MKMLKQFLSCLTGLFRRSAPRNARNKYLEFWNWFERNSDLLFNFETNRGNIFELLSRKLNMVDENLTFEFGPVKNNTREFILSADGMRGSFCEVENLYNQKPELEKWTIVKFRQRHDMSAFVITINDITYSPKDIYYRLFKDDLKIGIFVFVKDYKEELHGNMIFLMLDTALGEYDVETKVGTIECSDFNSEHFSDNLSLDTLPEKFDMMFKEIFG
jgi:hypothetical protein